MRQLTERHTSDRALRRLPRPDRPLRLSLEGFDAIGRRREKDLGDRPIHDRATLKDGVEVRGHRRPAQLSAHQRPRRFVRQFCRKLLGYSLGRAVQLSDEPLLDEMEAKLQANEYHVGTAIDMIVASRQFREIRGRDA